MNRFIIYTYQFAPLQNVTTPSLFESTENILPIQERICNFAFVGSVRKLSVILIIY